MDAVDFTQLRPGIIPGPARSSPPTPTRRGVFACFGCAVIGAGIAIAAMPRPTAPEAIVRITATPPITVTELVQVPVVVPSMVTVEIPAVAPAPTLSSDQLSFVFRAGNKPYIKLAELASETTQADARVEARPRHGVLQLSEDDFAMSATARVADADVPLAYRDWKGRKVIVDGKCTAKVTGFAVVARLTGETGYAGVEGPWKAADVLKHGAVVLAARLDGCEGTYARDASLPAIVIPDVVESDKLAAAAREALIHSEPSRQAQREWADMMTGDWHAKTEIQTRVLRHPKTGITFVSAHARSDSGCGGPDVNVWGLWRVDDGKLTAVQLRALGDIHAIEQLIDVDGDGELEMIGRPWLGIDYILARASGEEMTRLTLPYYGCPC